MGLLALALVTLVATGRTAVHHRLAALPSCSLRPLRGVFSLHLWAGPTCVACAGQVAICSGEGFAAVTRYRGRDKT
jgi:hypothetical protein